MIVRFYSGIAAGLPAIDEWDLSNLLIDGAAVSRDIAVAWLNLLYQASDARDFEPQAQLPQSTGDGLYHLLVLADAVQSRQSILHAAIANMRATELVVDSNDANGVLVIDEDDSSDAEDIRLKLDGRSYFLTNPCHEEPQLHQATAHQPYARGFAVFNRGYRSSEDEDMLIKQVQAQTEQLLFIAHKLQLQPLVQLVHEFIALNACSVKGMFSHSIDALLSERVLAAAGVTLDAPSSGSGSSSSSTAKDLFVESLLHMPITVSDAESSSLLAYEGGHSTLKFRARLNRDVLGSSKGNEVNVILEATDKGLKVIIGGVESFCSLHTIPPPPSYRRCDATEEEE